MVIWDAYNFCFVIGMFLCSNCSKTVIDEIRWMRFLKLRVELNVAISLK